MFPRSAHVIYEQSPLAEVICQLRFPPILRISSESPAMFQEQIRGAYPLFREKTGPAPLSLPEGLAHVLQVDLSVVPRGQNYDFLSEDEYWTVGLTREFIALSTTNYDTWEDFRNHLRLPLSRLVDLYSPAFFSRIGLRYRNLIRRSQVGLDESPWADLLEPHIAGELKGPEVAVKIKSAQRDILIATDVFDGDVRIRHGLVSDEKGEQCYTIDSDFFTTKRTDTGNAIEVLDEFNKIAGRLFRWCITDELHEALGPRPT